MTLSLWNKCQKMASKLDDVKEDWADEIDLDSLYMSNCSSCVIGQAFPELSISVIHLPHFVKNHWEYQALGWDRIIGMSWESYNKKLKQYWTTLINQRKNG